MAGWVHRPGIAVQTITQAVPWCDRSTERTSKKWPLIILFELSTAIYFLFKINQLKQIHHSYSMVNELAKRLIFQCFPNHSVADTLKNTLTSKTRHCQFVAGARGEESPLSRICHQILFGDEAFVSAHQQSQRSAAFKDTPRQQRRAVALSLAQAGYSDEAMARAYLSTALPCSPSPPLFTYRAEQSVGPYRH